MSDVPTTPRSRTVRAGPSSPTTTTPTTTRVTQSHTIQASPHYTTTRRHSLYGVEDRVVIDPGSRVWKVGFSGEGRPRDVFLACDGSGRRALGVGGTLWRLERAQVGAERAEEDRMLAIGLERCLRSVFHESLLTVPNSRKIIVVENPLLPLYIKEMIARILFENLQAPSISFASSHLLSLLAVGRITGLVVDCGHLESTALPIFAARPLYPYLRTTPLAGSRLTHHLRALLLLFGTYIPPPTSLSAAASVPAANRATRVPEEVLTDALLEDIKARCCFVGDEMDQTTEQLPHPSTPTPDPTRVSSPSVESDVPPSDSAASEASHRASGVSSSSSLPAPVNVPGANPRAPQGHLQGLAALYTRASRATDVQIKVIPPVAQQTGTGRGTLVVPGWVRERAAEVLFEGGDVDESSVAEVVLDSLLKVPVDLRKIMASSILVAGGTPMLPGFIPRLRAQIVRALAPPPARRYDRYAPLRSLTDYIAILNDPSPPSAPTSSRAGHNAGKAPAFTPATLAWIGGSLAGALKTGGAEVAREKWDESDPNADTDADTSAVEITPGSIDRIARNVLPDWTRSPLPAGAPEARAGMQAVEVAAVDA